MNMNRNQTIAKKKERNKCQSNEQQKSNYGKKVTNVNLNV